MATVESPTPTDLSPTTPGLIEIPSTAGTLDGFRAWARSESYPEHGRITFVNGKLIIDMSPERYESHLRIKDELNYIIGGLIRVHDLGHYYPDGGFFTHSAAKVSNEPDAMFASWATLESGKLAPPEDQPQDGKHIELVGTPDWVCEVVSDTSVKKDTRDLRTAYHKAIVPEYWLIDARGDEIVFQILVWRTQGYVAAENRNGWLRSVVFDREFQLTRDRDRVSSWKYELAQR